MSQYRSKSQENLSEEKIFFPLSKETLFEGVQGVLSESNHTWVYKDKFSLTNEFKKPVIFRALTSEPKGDDKSFVTVSPANGELQKKDKVEFEVTLKVFSSQSTNTIQTLNITIIEKKTLLSKNEKVMTASLKCIIPAYTHTTEKKESERKLTIVEKPKDKNKSSSGYRQTNRDSKTVTDVHTYELPPKIDITPNENLQAIGWAKDIDRNETEQTLKSRENGTFLLRWSNNTGSYVISYVQDAEVHHIAKITRCPNPGNPTAIMVTEQDSDKKRCVKEYASIGSFIEELKGHGILRVPIPNLDESQYVLSPPKEGPTGLGQMGSSKK